jgi:hypothetical protein
MGARWDGMGWEEVSVSVVLVWVWEMDGMILTILVNV